MTADDLRPETNEDRAKRLAAYLFVQQSQAQLTPEQREALNRNLTNAYVVPDEERLVPRYKSAD